jgi:hypothetical protein
MLETLEKRLTELQTLAKQHEAVLLQISGAVQELTNLISLAKGEDHATQARNVGQDPAGEH